VCSPGIKNLISHGCDHCVNKTLTVGGLLRTNEFQLSQASLVREIGLVKQQAPQDLQRRAAGVNLALEARYVGPE
jgi:hypothetical protein